MSIVISCVSLAVAVLALCNSYFSKPQSPSEEAQKQFQSRFFYQVKACVEYSKELPSKEEILSLMNEVEKNKSILETGSDDLRVKYVASQGCIEHVLACCQALGEVDHLIGVIHTPTVATPLCIRPEGPYEGVLDESIRHDLNKLLTVRSRAQIVREYLTKGGKLYVVYPQGGLEKRTSEQQQIYRDELERYSGSLIDWVLSCQQMDPDMIGATYLFRDQHRQVFAFSIKSRQANDIQQKSEWGIWFGPVADEVVANRVNAICDYLIANKGPDARQEVF